MPFRDKEIKNKAGEVVEVIKEQLPKYYLSNESEEHALAMRKWYKRYITWLANQFSRNSGVDRDDLIDEAYLGLARAVRDFRPEAGKVTNKNPKFHALARYKLREALTEAVYTMDSPINIPYKLREVHYYLTRIANIFGDLALMDSNVETQAVETYKVDLAELGIPEEYAKQIDYFKERIAVKAMNSDTTYEKMVKRAREIPRQLFVDDFYATEFEESSYEIDDEKLDRLDALDRVSRVLDDREYEMLMDYELEGFTVEMLKDKYNVSIGRVSQILNRARKKVQKNENYIMNGSNY